MVALLHDVDSMYNAFDSHTRNSAVAQTLFKITNIIFFLLVSRIRIKA